MEIERCTPADFQRILARFADYWDDDRTRERHHPIFIHELGDTAFVIRDDGVIAAYLLGFFAQTSPTAYVHMVAVHRDHRRRGLAKALYEHFIALAVARGCTRLKATAGPHNAASIAFHHALGMRAAGEPNADGIPVVRDYAGPGIDRVIFEMPIGPG